MIRSVTYASEQPGARLLVLGGVHGNESCGPIAIEKLLAEFEAGAIDLDAGRVTFVPVCNPEARKRNVRFLERNLNRFLSPMENPDTYEARLGNILCPLLEQCDVVLDLHSYTAGGPPFVFVGPDIGAEYEFAASLGPETLVTGFTDAYANSGRERREDARESMGTTEYARLFGAYGVTLECGGHKDQASSEVAYTAIHNALRHLGLVSNKAGNSNRCRLVKVNMVYFRQKEGAFARDWKHLEPVARDAVIARYDDGSEIRAVEDSVMVMPHADTPLDTEWFYLGIDTMLAA